MPEVENEDVQRKAIHICQVVTPAEKTVDVTIDVVHRQEEKAK